jgi:integration host factor subunit alpha
MALTKKRLILELQSKMGTSRRESEQLVNRLFEIIKGTLSQEDKILISGFGKFSVKKARRGRAKHTTENLRKASRKVVVFKPSGVLLNRLNGFPPPDPPASPGERKTLKDVLAKDGIHPRL